MNKALLQVWCHSQRGGDVMPDGCSLHVDMAARDEYLRSYYAERNSERVPYEYDYAEGEVFEVYLEDSLIEALRSSKSVRLDETSLRNLVGMDDLIFKY